MDDPNIPSAGGPPETPYTPAGITPTPPPAGSGTTIVIQSNMSLVIGLSMLVVGMLVGFLLRPVLSPTVTTEQVVVTQVVEVPVTVAAQTTSVVKATPTVSVAASPTPDLTAQKKQLMQVVMAQARHLKGNPNAKIIIIEFSDFQWPYCGRFAADAERQIDQTYVETGQAQFVYFHFPFLGDESFVAAEASECANDQGKFWEYHDQLFASQNGENQGAFAAANLKAFAKALELDTTAFDNCLDSGKYTQQVQQDASFAQQLGVRSTPTFLVNGEPLLGAQPFSAFEEIIKGLNLLK